MDDGVGLSNAHLVSPPHHQVGEGSDPAYRPNEGDGEELLGGLKGNG